MPATTPPSRQPRQPQTSAPDGAAAGPAAAVPAAAAAGLDDLTYEQAREELVGVVARLEAGGETLEGSLALWERGEALAARCQQWLDGARARLDAARGAVPTPAPTSVPVSEPTADDHDSEDQ